MSWSYAGMPTSSNLTQRGLDAVPIVYALLSGHPASAVCENHIRNHTGWLTTSVTLLEACAVLRKVYGVDPPLAAQKLTQFAAAPITVLPVDAALATVALSSAAQWRIDLADAVLLEICRMHGAAIICTDDARLSQVCVQLGLIVETPIPSVLRPQIAAWESASLPSKGLARLLHHVQTWLDRQDQRVALDFWNQTGAGSHLP
jgi:predicted nucleic acid-binding protein